MGAGPFSSDSKTKTQSDQSDYRVAASEKSIASGGKLGKGVKNVTGGGVVAGNKSNVGGVTFGNLGAGATVTLSSTVDSKPLENAAGLLSTLVNQQSNLLGTSAADAVKASQIAADPAGPAGVSEGTWRTALLAGVALIVVILLWRR